MRVSGTFVARQPEPPHVERRTHLAQVAQIRCSAADRQLRTAAVRTNASCTQRRIYRRVPADFRTDHHHAPPRALQEAHAPQGAPRTAHSLRRGTAQHAAPRHQSAARSHRRSAARSHRQLAHLPPPPADSPAADASRTARHHRARRASHQVGTAPSPHSAAASHDRRSILDRRTPRQPPSARRGWGVPYHRRRERRRRRRGCRHGRSSPCHHRSLAGLRSKPLGRAHRHHHVHNSPLRVQHTCHLLQRQNRDPDFHSHNHRDHRSHCEQTPAPQLP